MAALVCHRMKENAEGKLIETDETVRVPARAIFVATGAKPNIAYHFEHRGSFEVETGQYKPHELGGPLPVSKYCKTRDFGPFTSYQKEGHRVSYLGDTHPTFNGSVVKAVASGYRIYPKIMAALGELVTEEEDDLEYAAFREDMQDLFQPRLIAVTRCAVGKVAVPAAG